MKDGSNEQIPKINDTKIVVIDLKIVEPVYFFENFRLIFYYSIWKCRVD